MTETQCPYPMDLSGRDVHGEAELLRKRGRATQVELPDGVVVWNVTDYALAKQLLTDPRVSRDAYQHWPAWENGEGELARSWPLAIWVADRNMMAAYGAEHTRLRKLVAKAFTARRSAALRPRIEAITSELLDGLAATPSGEPVDLREQFAYPLPTRVISELLGMPDDVRDSLLGFVHKIFDTQASAEEARANEEGLYTLLAELVAVKRESPGDDLITGLIQVRDADGGSGLSERELVDTVLLMFTAGHETTVNLLDHAVYSLLRHPEQLARVRGGGSTWEDVIEETLRLEAPLANMPMRYAVETLELGDVTIPAGDAMIISFGAAGRDPSQHGDTAGEFDIARDTRRDHLAFGHGVHHCLGAPLARLEASIALAALFDRFPGLDLAVPPQEIVPLGSFISNGHLSLPVRLGH
ncbi:cytochrome P450 [Streptomyces sp. NPDC046316]|uniref:cytochrome P450 family protein n=1 Tax=Streptomyces sp. NPDC046316 TaxID=3154494 RepID=UPI0033C6C43B